MLIVEQDQQGVESASCGKPHGGLGHLNQPCFKLINRHSRDILAIKLGVDVAG